MNLKQLPRRLLNSIRETSWKRWVLYLILIAFAVFYLLPLWVTITTSLKTDAEIAASSPLAFPANPTIAPYIEAFNELKVPLLNSVFITVGAVAGSVFLGSICGYIFAKYRFKYDSIVFMLLTVGIFLPYQAILVPLYQTIGGLNLIGTIPGLILAHTAFGIPVCALMFRIFYGSIPDSIIKQAQVDGAGTWKIYRRIVLPSTMLAMVAVIIFQFTSIWNDFLFGLVLNVGGAMPATVGLNQFMGAYGAQYNLLMAGAIWVALPVLIMFLVLGKYLVRGYMAGAVSGV